VILIVSGIFFKREPVESVVNFAAESPVDRSIHDLSCEAISSAWQTSLIVQEDRGIREVTGCQKKGPASLER